MLDKILVATGNQGKLKEIREILEGIEIIGMRDVGILLQIHTAILMDHLSPPAF